MYCSIMIKICHSGLKSCLINRVVCTLKYIVQDVVTEGISIIANSYISNASIKDLHYFHSAFTSHAMSDISRANDRS